MQVVTGNGTCKVRVDGPESRHTVVLLPAVQEAADVYDQVCVRLHNSGLRTVVPESIEGLDDTDILTILDELKLGWANLMGNREGAELAWRLAAKSFGRFASLVAVDRGHPALADAAGNVAEAACPAVELPTTVMVGGPKNRNWAELSGRHVYGEFRVVELDVDNIPVKASHELATEIVLRTSSW